MRNRARRLNDVRSEIAALPNLPPTARALERARRAALEDLDNLERAWLGWHRESALVGLEKRVRDLTAVAAVLANVFERRQELTDLLADFTKEADAVTEPALRRRLHEHIEAWQVEAARMADYVKQVPQAEDERRHVQELFERAVDLRDSVRLWRRAERHPSPGETSQDEPPLSDLVAARQDLLQALTADDLMTESGRRRLKERRDRLQAAFDLEPEAPRGAALDPDLEARLAQSLDGLWDWARVDEEHAAAVAELARRQESLADGALGADGLVGLTAAAAELLDRIETTARRARGERRARLAAQVRTLAHLTVQEDLERRLQELETQEPDMDRVGPQHHRAWSDTCRDLEGLFRDRLQNEHQRVDAAFRDAATRVDERLTTILGGPLLGRTVTVGLEALRGEALDLRSRRGVDAQFEALERLRRIRDDIEALARQAEEELEAVDRRQHTLLQRRRRLEELSSTLPVTGPIVGTIPEPCRDPHDSHDDRLDDRADRLDTFEKVLRIAEQKFQTACAAAERQLEHGNRELSTRLDLAETLGLMPAVHPTGSKPGALGRRLPDPASLSVSDGPSKRAPDTPDAAAAAVASAEARRRTLKGAFQAALSRARAAFPDTLEQLRQLDTSSLKPGDKVLVATYVDTASTETTSRSEGPAENCEPDAATTTDRDPTLGMPETAEFDRITAWLGPVQKLIERSEGRRRRAVERRDRLVQRLRSFEQEGGADICPEMLIDRCHALIYGLYHVELTGPDTDLQLQAAENLLDRLTEHAGRLMAMEMELDRRTLHRQGGDRAHALLTEMDAVPDHDPPTVELRRRVRLAARPETAHEH